MQDFFPCGSSVPVRVEQEGSAAAWLEVTLVAPSVQGHGLPPWQELWPSQSFLEPPVAGDQKAFGQSFSVDSPIQALTGLPCLESIFVFSISGT